MMSMKMYILRTYTYISLRHVIFSSFVSLKFFHSVYFIEEYISFPVLLSRASESFFFYKVHYLFKYLMLAGLFMSQFLLLNRQH